MKTKLLAAASLFAFFGATSAALADAGTGERWPRWYMGLSGGIGFLQETDLSGARTGSVDYAGGKIITASLGYRPNFGNAFMDSLRFEVEGGYHSNQPDDATVNGVPATLSGRAKLWSAMANAVFDVRNESKWTPYLGAGAGWADLNYTQNTALGNTNDSDSGFAYQFLAGVAYAPESVPLTEWTLGYRYFTFADPELATATGALKLDDYTSHNVEVGGRFRF